MKIYTKTGDDGTTGLLGGQRVEKTNAIIHALGEVDELNSSLGLVVSTNPPESLTARLGDLQVWLFDLGAMIASTNPERYTTRIPALAITDLEMDIDRFDNELPALKNFVLPGGTLSAAALHQARSVCRRAERACIAAGKLGEPAVFLNRLSDWLFTAARYANFVAGQQETLYHSR